MVYSSSAIFAILSRGVAYAVSIVVLLCLGLYRERSKFISCDTRCHPAIKSEEKKKRSDPTSVADA